MQQFFMDYGLYLLIALLIGIAVIFLATRGRGGGALEDRPAPPVADAHRPSAPAASDIPVIPDPAPVVAVPPLPLVDPVPPVADVAPDPVAPPASAAPVDAAPQQADTGAGDDLLRLKGVGPKLKAQLTQLGVTRFAQIAAWSDNDLATIDAQLGAFKGRPVRDQWIDQAKYLAAGDLAGFEAKYGKF
ncbi:MAG: hypothetical protein ABW164_01940 [Sphingobium sp.]